jgi:hypothetical protein
VDAGLQTPRLSLRRPGVADVDVVLRLHQDPLAVAHNPGDALADRPAAQQLLQRWSAWRRVLGRQLTRRS